MTTASPAPVRGVVLVQTADASGALLREALSAHDELEILAEVPTTSEAVTEAERRSPGVIVMDVGLEDLAGRGVLRSIHHVSPQTRVVLHARAADVDDAPGTGRWLSRLVDLVVDPDRGPTLNARLVLSDETRSVPLARGFVGDLLNEWDLLDLIPSVELLASELVANAVRHVTGPCALELTAYDGVMQIAVADAGHGMPDLQVLGPMNESGRGLHIVSAFSTAWGVDHLDDGGKLVWAELAPVPTGVS